ncbi:MAG: sensor histidine kinase [Actinomycetota bacterium]|nr:sensor histidine kinase [Actinomycetota bacterium]
MTRDGTEPAPRRAGGRFDHLIDERSWAWSRWGRVGLAAPSLVFLVVVVAAADDEVAAPWVSYAALGGFAVAFLLSYAVDDIGVGFWLSYAAMGATSAVLVATVPGSSTTMFIYLGVSLIHAVGRRAVPWVLALVVAAFALPPLLASWHAYHLLNGAIVVMMLLFVYGFDRAVRTNRALRDARAEITRLAAENERQRIARDLHDLLGHSLTAITTKSTLAHRLAESGDVGRASTEIAAVAELGRDALADVRDAVAGYREVTLAGEVATGAEVLRAAGIAARLPSGDELAAVPHDVEPLFGWVVREAITNVVRHSCARTCEVRIGADRVEVIDDGRGGRSSGPGSGLDSLRERVSAHGGDLAAGPRPGGGWRLAVVVPARHESGTDAARLGGMA